MSSNTIPKKAVLEKQLRQNEARIQEVKNRLPAHSIKPVMMRELIELEDERDHILAQLKALSPHTNQ